MDCSRTLCTGHRADGRSGWTVTYCQMYKGPYFLICIHKCLKPLTVEYAPAMFPSTVIYKFQLKVLLKKRLNETLLCGLTE